MCCTRCESTAAEREWHELLHEQGGLVEDEGTDDTAQRAIPGVYSYHERLYSLLSENKSTLLGALRGIPLESYENWVSSLGCVFKSWPEARRLVGVKWITWLFSREQRGQGYPALCDFVDAQSAYTSEEHLGCDDAGWYSLQRAASQLLTILAKKVNGMPTMHAAKEAACEMPTRPVARIHLTDPP